jgi:hypothetical protein
MDDKQKYMRWLEEMWNLHNSISREEKRKEEVLKVFRRPSLPLKASRRRSVFSALGTLPVGSRCAGPICPSLRSTRSRELANTTARGERAPLPGSMDGRATARVIGGLQHKHRHHPHEEQDRQG